MERRIVLGSELVVVSVGGQVCVLHNQGVPKAKSLRNVNVPHAGGIRTGHDFNNESDRLKRTSTFDN